MIIKDNRRAMYEFFGDLKVGDVFCEEEGDNYFMKIEEYDDYNAIDLGRALVVRFNNDEGVIKVNATLTIE
jgi:hypothetical protein